MTETAGDRRLTVADMDLLVVLGKNLGVDSGRADVQARHDHLSTDSRLNLLAAGELYRSGMTILLSGGDTIGSSYRSQPQYARDFLHRRFPGIPARCVMLDESGFDTAASAEFVGGLVRDDMFGYIGLLSVGYHVENAAKLFQNHGVPLTAVFRAEDIVRRRSAHHTAFVEAWQQSARVHKEERREAVRGLLLNTFDKRGRLLRKLTQTRTD